MPEHSEGTTRPEYLILMSKQRNTALFIQKHTIAEKALEHVIKEKGGRPDL